MDYLPIYHGSMFQDPTNFSPNAALRAIARLLAPLARLALAHGVKYQQIDELLRQAMVDEAQRAMMSGGAQRALRGGKINTSQMSVMTGLQRKDISRIQQHSAQSPKEPQDGGARSLASQVLLHWANELDRHPERVVLPITADGQAPSFARVSAAIVTDVHHRAVLDELIRLGLVRETDGEVELLHDAFVPRGASADKLAVLADNTSAHLASAVNNLGPDGLHCMEQAIWGKGISLADCERLDGIARQAWASAHQTLFDAISATPEAPPNEARHRIHIGMYAHAEPLNDEGV
jgi:hypothetical protein